VVDTDATASKVLDVMLKEKTGRVTFMPLNRLKPKIPTYPNAQDAIPLMEKLQFDPKLEKAFQQVFGKTCVCRDLNVAAAYVKSHGINTITLDGDKVDRKGALTGGYHDVRKSRIEAVKEVQQWRSKFESDEKKSKEVKVSITRAEQEITKVTESIALANNQQIQTRDGRERLLEEGNSLTKQHERMKERVLRLEGEGNDLETELNGLGAKLQTFDAELTSPMAEALTAQEEHAMELLGKEVGLRQKNLVELGRLKGMVRPSFTMLYVHTQTTYTSAGEP
jgi:structural maintenance of chromosome 3 (chondroitin sulfate proteoglycan 6)